MASEAKVRPQPPPIIRIGRLTPKVTTEHLQEIFATFGKIKRIDIHNDGVINDLGHGFAFVEYENKKQSEKALKFMNGGMNLRL